MQNQGPDHALPGEAARDTAKAKAKAKGREEQIKFINKMQLLWSVYSFYSYQNAALKPIVKQTSDTIMQ